MLVVLASTVSAIAKTAEYKTIADDSRASPVDEKLNKPPPPPTRIKLLSIQSMLFCISTMKKIQAKKEEEKNNNQGIQLKRRQGLFSDLTFCI